MTRIQRKDFSEDKRTNLCDLARGRRHRLSLTSLLRLLRVADPDARFAMAVEMVENKWSTEDLTKAVRQFRQSEDGSGLGRPLRRGAGRRLKPPADAAAIAAEFVELATRWVNYADHVAGDPLLDDLPPRQRDAIETLTRSIRRRAAATSRKRQPMMRSRSASKPAGSVETKRPAWGSYQRAL